MTIKKNLLILIPMFFLLGIATFSLLEKDIESEVLNEGSGCRVQQLQRPESI